MRKTLFCFGCGYSAQALAALLLPVGWRMIGTTRSSEGAERLQKLGIEAVIWPGAELTPYLHAASHLLLSAAPTEAGDPLLTQARTALEAAGAFDWTGYLSTTGVYGDHGGDWVDETTALTPSTRRGQLRVAAEAAWQQVERPSLNLHIFRLAGIYGPGRGPFAKVRAGTARRIIKPGQVFSRIHVEDIAQVLNASINRPRPGAIYNLCDDDPAPPQDVIAYAAELLGLPIPPEEPWDSAKMTAMARSFYAESKRVRNDRIKDELGVSLLFPTYRAGLADLLKREMSA